MKRFVALSAPALIVLCFVGFAAAAHSLAAPSGVTMFSTEEGVLVSWDQNDAAAHWVAWMNDDEYRAARDAGDWTTALNYASVPSGDTHVVPAESLIKGDDYWFVVGSESRQTSSATSWGAWQALTVDHEMALDDALTRAYVERAIAYYDANGLDATTAQYRSVAGAEDGRQLTLLDAEEGVLLVYRALPTLEGQYVGPGSRFPALGSLIAVATEEGHWDTTRGINAVTKQ